MPKNPFTATFEYELDVELPNSRTNLYYFPHEPTVGGSRLIRFSIDGKQWVGQFLDSGIGGVTGFHPWVKEDWAAVILNGDCYTVNVREPEEWRMLDARMIREYYPVADEGVVLIAEFTELYCYGADGLRWNVPRLTQDFLEIESVEHGVIHCKACVGGVDDHRFTVDLHSGVTNDPAVLEWLRMTASWKR